MSQHDPIQRVLPLPDLGRLLEELHQVEEDAGQPLEPIGFTITVGDEMIRRKPGESLQEFRARLSIWVQRRLPQ